MNAILLELLILFVVSCVVAYGGVYVVEWMTLVMWNDPRVAFKPWVWSLAVNTTQFAAWSALISGVWLAFAIVAKVVTLLW